MKISTANSNRKRKLRREAYSKAFEYHTERCARLSRNGRLSEISNSGYVRRQKRRAKVWAQMQTVVLFA